MSAVLAQPMPAPGKRAAVFLAAALHLSLAGLVLFGMNWQTAPAQPLAGSITRAAPEPVPPPQAQTLTRPMPQVSPLAKVKEERAQSLQIKPDQHQREIFHKPREKSKLARKSSPAPRYDPMQHHLENELRKTAERKSMEPMNAKLHYPIATSPSASLEHGRSAVQ